MAPRVFAAVLLLAIAGAPLADGAIAAKRRGVLPPHNPANVAPVPNYAGCNSSGSCSEGPPCYSAGDFAPQFDSTGCEQAELQAIDNARAKEGVGPMYLPADFNSLSGDEQLLVVIDLERVGRGLPPIAGIVASLDRVAQAGTQAKGQRPGVFEDPSFPANFAVGPGTSFAYRCHASGPNGYICNGLGQPGASIAAGGEINPLDADYGWMYNDGPGGSNYECTARTTTGCWGHRDNILGSYPTKTRFVAARSGARISEVSPRRAVLVMGAGSLQPNGAGGAQGNWTAIFTSVTGSTPQFVYSWKQALAAGADAPPA
jgi:hypothetical protein